MQKKAKNFARVTSISEKVKHQLSNVISKKYHGIVQNPPVEITKRFCMWAAISI